MIPISSTLSLGEGVIGLGFYDISSPEGSKEMRRGVGELRARGKKHLQGTGHLCETINITM